MLIDHIKNVLTELQSENISVDEALGQLRSLPYEDLGFAKLDHHRLLRRGFPEVVLCDGKTTDQVAQIVQRFVDHGGTVLASKASPEMFRAIREVAPSALYHEEARMVVVPAKIESVEVENNECSSIVVLSAGTSDIPIAEEAVVTAETLGASVKRVYDVGVAGIHRLLDHRETLDASKVIIVVAGMEGALASVIAGLTSQPIIAVPTSVGYGASFDGLAALLSMLNCCAPGVVVVNIDNGFGAGYFAALIASQDDETD